ncbi:MAG: hypothetical protein VCA39_02665 [Pseudomonas sp.]|uniref:hypothetical protein n=1 Tax=Pseudomonas sp. TaxID=306 RepID=UPI00398275F3
MIIDNGKQPDEPYNISLWLWLPSDTPYGNFQLKYMKIVQRLDEANRKIAESCYFWNCCIGESDLLAGAFERHIFSNESTIYMLRRAADELVSLIWCLSKFEETGSYPSKIKIDCLGAVIAQPECERHEALSQHIEIMNILNDIANAFKHSFINSDHTLIGAGEPRIHALGLAYNKLSSEPEFYDVPLSTLVEKYNNFYRSCVDWLRSYSQNNR